MRAFFLGLFLLTAFSWAGICADPEVRVEMQDAVDPSQENFRNELSLVARKSAALGKTRFSKIKKINDSYQLTAQAIQVLAERGDVVSAIPLLGEASKKYDGNRMAYLLLGAAYEMKGDRDAAAGAYGNFYRYSLTLVPFERELIGPSSLEIFRGYVKKRFSEWGLKLSEPLVGFELRKMRSLVMLETSKAGQRINLILPFLVVVGLPLIILTRMIPVELPSSVSFFGVGLYLLTVLGYLLWAAHFFLGLPFLVSIEAEYILFFGAGTALICLLFAANLFFDPRHEPKTGDSKTCPHCRATILRVSVECPVCKRPCPR